MSAYAGIGSRRTPAEALATIETVAEQLARAGWTLRTGMSPGADESFYRGALAARGRIELYLPWPGFQANARSPAEGGEVFALAAPAQEAYAQAARFHPSWSKLGQDERRLRARDVHQVLGYDLASPVTLVVCWTPDAGLDGTGPLAGGTGQALRIAHARGIPVLNLAREDHRRRVLSCAGAGPDRRSGVGRPSRHAH
ncbi:MAG: hypothetical protein ABSG95_06625 [Solirubrobacteraceae bacterium]